MVDRINIRFEINAFKGSLKKCIFRSKNKNIKIYCIPSMIKNNHTKIWVILSRRTDRIYFVGSLRKWYHGENTLVDFNKKSFVAALKRLACVLDMPFSELGLGAISYIEIGLNVRTRIANGCLLEKMVAYKSFHRECQYIKKGSLYFGVELEKRRNSIRTLTIYDKCKEIVDKEKNPMSAFKIKRAFETFEKHGYYFTRMEFKLKGKKSLKSMNLENVRNLDALIEGWNNLYVAWTFHIAKIIVASQMNLSLPMTRSERWIAERLAQEGVKSVMENVLSECTSKTADGLKAKKYRERKRIHDVLLKFGTFADYNTFTFKADVALSLIRQCKKESQIPVGALVRNLWKPTYTLLV